MKFTYHDNVTGDTRIKRRYVWAAWAFVAGLVCGIVLTHAFS
ncbi:MAG: hypothetical protein ACRETW_10610 [Stenotrophobium sp.]